MKAGYLSPAEFLEGFDTCSLSGDDANLYNTFASLIKNGDRTNKNYTETVNTFNRMGARLLRFYIPEHGVPTFLELSKNGGSS